MYTPKLYCDRLTDRAAENRQTNRRPLGSDVKSGGSLGYVSACVRTSFGVGLRVFDEQWAVVFVFLATDCVHQQREYDKYCFVSKGAYCLLCFLYAFSWKLDEQMSFKSLSFLTLSATSSHYSAIHHRHYNKTYCELCIHIHPWLRLKSLSSIVILKFLFIQMITDIKNPYGHIILIIWR